MDVDGRWEQLEWPYQLKLQKLSIRFDTIDPQGIGEPPYESAGDIRYRFEVWDHVKGIRSLLKEWIFFNPYTTLTPFDVSDFIPGGAEVTVGPRLANTGSVSLLLSVREFDDGPFADELATSLNEYIQIEPGGFTEDDPIELVITAKQEPDPFDPENELDIDVHVKVNVEHIRP